MKSFVAVVVCLGWSGVAGAILAGAEFEPAEIDADGVITHRVESSLQSGPTDLRILLPRDFATHREAERRRLPVVYLLPVEAGRESRYGDAMAIARQLDVANRFGVICVAPSFALLPWYADHPSDARIAQESYFVHELMPFVEANYPALAERRGRLLCGFSKSGWGAWSLLLRHPDLFERAASWDAPLLMNAPGKYGSGPIFGTADNFSQYEIVSLLESFAVRNCIGGKTGARPRLILHGFGNFVDHRELHDRLERLGIPHDYRDGPSTPHVWSVEWMEPAVAALTAEATAACASDSGCVAMPRGPIHLWRRLLSGRRRGG